MTREALIKNWDVIQAFKDSLGKDIEDYEKELLTLQIENKQLKERIEELEICQHPYKYLERNENGLFCQKCKTQISSDPNIY